jgi:hypothetical protein
MIAMMLLDPNGEVVPGETNIRVLNRVIRNELGKDYKFEHIYKHEKLKFLGNSQAKQ